MLSSLKIQGNEVRNPYLEEIHKFFKCELIWALDEKINKLIVQGIDNPQILYNQELSMALYIMKFMSIRPGSRGHSIDYQGVSDLLADNVKLGEKNGKHYVLLDFFEKKYKDGRKKSQSVVSNFKLYI